MYVCCVSNAISRERFVRVVRLYWPWQMRGNQSSSANRVRLLCGRVNAKNIFGAHVVPTCWPKRVFWKCAYYGVHPPDWIKLRSQITLWLRMLAHRKVRTSELAAYVSAVGSPVRQRWFFKFIDHDRALWCGIAWITITHSRMCMLRCCITHVHANAFWFLSAFVCRDRPLMLLAYVIRIIEHE